MKKTRNPRMLKLLLAAIAMLFALGSIQAIAGSPLYKGEPAKYVFLFIGDGMGLPQKTAAEQFSKSRLVMDQFPAQGITTTYAADRFITDSAASATSVASGQKTNCGMIGVTPDQKPVKTIAEIAKEKGMKVGIISSVSIDHATPAAFYSHVKSRSMYHDIDHALVKSGFDFFGGGGLKDPAGKSVLKKDPNAKTLGDAIKEAEKAGYKVISNKADFMKVKAGDKVLAWNEWLQDGGAMPYVMDMTEKDITLPEFTAKAIEVLDNPNGFFIMVEGGKIDWACHANDGAASIHNTLSFDKSVQVAVEFAKSHPEETLIVTTGDHECGGLTLGFAGTQYDTNFNVLGSQKESFQKFTDETMKNYKGDFNGIKPVITKAFGLKFEGDPKKDIMVLEDYQVKQLEEAFNRAIAGDTEKSDDPVTAILYGGYNPLAVKLTHILNQKAGLGWTSYSHTGVPVGTSAMGVGQDIFNGYYDNADIAFKIMSVMGVEPKIHFASAPINRKVASK